jgi:Tfp pilus assembly protein PilX
MIPGDWRSGTRGPRSVARPSFAPRHPAGDERGFALVAAVLVLLLTGIIVATYYAVTTGERIQAANVQVARGSLYAADAGVRTMEQTLANMAEVKLDSLALLQSGSTNPLISAPATLFPAGAIVASATSPGFSSSGSLAFSDSTLRDSGQVYNYRFTITSTGTRGAYGRRVVQSQGILRVSASRGSFADFLIFTNTHTMSNGDYIWFTSDGSFDGRMHTNGEFRFAYKPTFQDLTTSVNAKAWYYNKGNPVERNANSNGTIDVPYFYGGFTRNVSTIDLPANSYSQQNAALGRDPSDTSSPTNTQIRAALGLSGTTAPPTGVYLPNSGGAVTGGIYVQGTLTQCLMYVNSDGNQVYSLKQSSSTDLVTVNHTAGTTTFYDASAGTTTTYAGVPRGVLYTNGTISDLRGPDRVSGEPPPALADDTQMLVAATGDVVLQRDVTYEDYEAGDAVLGIYSSGGNVRVGTSAPNDVNVDAFVMATGTSGAFQVDSYDSGSPRGTLHLRGGSVTRYYGAFYTFDQSGHLQTGYGRDFHYDRRGLRPPYYPLTPRLTPDQPLARTLSWKEL